MSRFLDHIRPSFEEGGRFARLFPVYEAMDGFLNAVPIQTLNAPFGRDPLDVKRYMFLVIIGLTPPLIASTLFFGPRILLMLLVSYAAGGMAEALFSIIRREEINEGFLVTGFLFPLILPPALPLWMVAVGVVFGVVVGKEVFGGTGRNLFNPALVGRIFLAIGYPSVMAESWVLPAGGTADVVTSATPLMTAKGGVTAASLELFLGRVTGSAGETSAVAIIIGGIYLLVIGIASWRTVVSVLLSFTIFTAILHTVVPVQVPPVLFHLLSGGFLFGTFFMATDPVTSPVTQSGKWVYGMLIGTVTILIRSFSGFVEGMMFAILLGNICAPLIDEVIIRNRMRRYAHGR